MNLYRNINRRNTFGIDKIEEKYKKQKEISSLAIIIGILVAFMANASLFDLLSSKPYETLFWINGLDLEGWEIAKFIIGILLTGFFLSFGSRFFHDLLDVLYNIKELKRKSLNPQLYDQNNSSDTLEFINSDSFNLAKKALSKEGKKLKKRFPDLISTLEIGNTANNQIGIIANLKQKPPINFPKHIKTKLSSGKDILIEIEVIISEIAKAQNGIGYSIENTNYNGSSGALGSILLWSEDYDSKFALTCSHVALAGKADNLEGFLNYDSYDYRIDIIDYYGNVTEGQLIYAKLDQNNDTAIIKIEENSYDFNNELPDGNTFNAAISVFSLNPTTDKVFFYSIMKEAVIEGSIHKRLSKEEVFLEYDDRSVKSFSDLIVIGDNSGGYWSSISEKGDSGSVLYDQYYRPFALIIGGGSQFTYAIPLLNILNDTNTEIYQS